MPGDILDGALSGALGGGIAAGLLLLIMKLLGKPIGKQKVPAQERPQTMPVPPTWKTESKRVFLGIVWFFVIWFLARMVVGAIVGAIAGGQAGAHAVPGADHKEAAFLASQTAVLNFLQSYGLLILLGSLAASVLGTVTGFLPGTKRPTMIVPTANPTVEGQWSPPPTGAA